MKVSAYIPCFNNRATLPDALASLRAQGSVIDEILVIDDGSTDGSADLAAAEPGVRVIRHERNLGRGAARATAMAKARHELVLSCDATGTLGADFVRRALPWFADPRIAAVSGRATPPPARNAVERWRERWLFRLDQTQEVRHGAPLATHGAMVRASAVREVGGYTPHLRHSEDAELGRRLAQAGFDLVHDPQLHSTSLAQNTLTQVLERYWRWNVGEHERTSWRDYLRQTWYSLKVMALRDLRAGDPAAAVISLFSPHYQFWRTWWRGRRSLAPRDPKSARIAVYHSEWERRWPECERGVYPRNQLWGIDALQTAGFTIDPVRTKSRGFIAALSRTISWLTRGRVRDLHVDFALLGEHRDATAIYVATGGVFLVPLLRALGLFRPRVFVWAFAPPLVTPWWKFRGLEFRALPRHGYDGVICLVAKAEAWFRTHCPQALVRKIDWGVDSNLFTADTVQKHGSYFFANGKTLRDYTTLIEACRNLDSPVRIIAPRASIDGRDLPKNVNFLESTSDPPDAAVSYGELRAWYADAIAVLIPLVDDPHDTCGLTNILEAMSMGRPIIKTRSGCLDIDIEALGVGIHVAPGDTQGWRDAMQLLATDPVRARQMGERGLELVRTHFNSVRFGREMVEFTEELLTQ